jgi:hypothetical protein
MDTTAMTDHWALRELRLRDARRAVAESRLPLDVLLDHIKQSKSLTQLANLVNQPEHTVKDRLDTLTVDEADQVEAQLTVTAEQLAS